MALFGAKKTKDDDKELDLKKESVKTETSEEAKELSMKDLYAEEKVKKASKSKKATAASRYDGAFRVLVKPLVTEKATELSAHNKYAFVISSEANKIEVAKAIQVVYGVKAVAVNIISMKGKVVTRGRIKGKRKDWKKAIVTLKKGETIKIYEGV